jgi:PTH1 family peptidyl-tRNA hydrolase
VETTALKLIAGLGNPGQQYATTRHNVGADWVRALAEQFQIPLTLESKFKAEIGRGVIYGQDVRLMVPTTFMNNSGEAIGAVAHFYKILPQEILVAHDEVAFAPGQVRLKSGGGENGHNGLKSVRARLGNQDGYHRLRIGVGHPGNKNLVNAYLTQQTPPATERQAIAIAGELPSGVLRDVLAGHWQGAMTALHTDESGAKSPAAGAEQADKNVGSSNPSGEKNGI